MTTDDFTDDELTAELNMTTNDLTELIGMDKVRLVKVIVGDEPDPSETGVELEISTDPYDLDTL